MRALSEGGTLTGRMLTSPPPNSVNLTTEGTLDWAHWGNGGVAGFDHKGGVTQRISNYTVIGTNPVQSFSDNLTSFSWTDGTPNPSATNVTTGVDVNDLGNGFSSPCPRHWSQDLEGIRGSMESPRKA